MRVLVLSFYYEPDLSAGSFRATSLVRALRKERSSNLLIDVVTTRPNRYNTFDPQASESETDVGLTIHRISLPKHSSDMFGQSKAFWRFAVNSIRLTKNADYDLVFATSSRLMTAALGALIARRNRSKLYLDIRDIFVDTMKDISPIGFAGLLGSVLSALERWTVSHAERINLVSAGFAEYFRLRYPRKEYSFFTNGVDDEFLVGCAAGSTCGAKSPLNIVYAGNIGEGQGLHVILPQLAARLRGRAVFQVIGDGGRKLALEQALLVAGVSDLVDIRPPVPRASLIEAYRAADVLFLHLNDYEAFKKVLPSKLFEYAAIGKPVWAGVGGYAAKFVESEISNAAVFTPCDAAAAESALAKLVMQPRARNEFIQKYSRANIMQQMARDILQIVPS